MLSNLLKLFDIFQLFGVKCSKCGRTKTSGNKWESPFAKDKIFCTKKCLNNYLIMFGDIKCDQCGKDGGANTIMHYDMPDKIFCKESCLTKYYIKEECINCGKKHGTRIYRSKEMEFGSKECKEIYLKKQKLLKGQMK